MDQILNDPRAYESSPAGDQGPHTRQGQPDHRISVEASRPEKALMRQPPAVLTHDLLQSRQGLARDRAALRHPANTLP